MQSQAAVNDAPIVPVIVHHPNGVDTHTQLCSQNVPRLRAVRDFGSLLSSQDKKSTIRMKFFRSGSKITATRMPTTGDSTIGDEQTSRAGKEEPSQRSHKRNGRSGG